MLFGTNAEKIEESLMQSPFENRGGASEVTVNQIDDTLFYPMSPFHMSLYYAAFPEIEID